MGTSSASSSSARLAPNDAGVAQEVGERDHGDDPARALRARGNRRTIQAVADREERREVLGVEADGLAVVVEHHEHRPGHGRNVALPPRAGAPVPVASAACER